jgi:multiple sugar transport system substrate-binding protein
MLKRTIAVLALACLALGAFAAPKQVALKVAVPRDTPENKARIQADLEKIKRFETANPDIKVTAVNFDYDNTGDFSILQAAGQAPDVLVVWATEAQLFVSKKWGVPLDSYLKTWEKKSWYNPDSFNPFTVSGKIYGIPDFNYVKHVIYNKKMFLEHGVPLPKNDWTWADFQNAAIKCTDKAKGIAGFAPMGRGSESGWGFTDFIYQAGGEVESVNKEGKAKAVFDSPEAIAAAQFFRDLKWKYDAIPANWANGWGDVYNVFGSGQAAMVLDADNGRLTPINSLKMDPKDIGVVPMPKGPGPKGRQAGVMGGTYWVINGGSARTKAVQDAAWKWVIFEKWGQEGLDNVKIQIEEARALKQYRCQFQYSPLLPDAPYVKQERALLIANPDAAVAWGDDAFLAALPKTAHAEPPVAAQDVYGKYLANVVGTLFSTKDADPAAVMKEFNAKFQKEVLDPINAGTKK